jgi:hypothetical protein
VAVRGRAFRVPRPTIARAARLSTRPGSSRRLPRVWSAATCVASGDAQKALSLAALICIPEGMLLRWGLGGSPVAVGSSAAAVRHHPVVTLTSSHVRSSVPRGENPGSAVFSHRQLCAVLARTLRGSPVGLLALDLQIHSRSIQNVALRPQGPLCLSVAFFVCTPENRANSGHSQSSIPVPVRVAASTPLACFAREELPSSPARPSVQTTFRDVPRGWDVSRTHSARGDSPRAFGVCRKVDPGVPRPPVVSPGPRRQS